MEHSLWSDQTNICLFTPDVGEKKDHDDSIEHYTEVLKAAGVKNVGKIIPYDQLKKEHKGTFLEKHSQLILVRSRAKAILGQGL